MKKDLKLEILDILEDNAKTTAEEIALMLDVPAGVALESEAFTVPFCSEDRIEGMKAFLEKREAQFKNR